MSAESHPPSESVQAARVDEKYQSPDRDDADTAAASSDQDKPAEEPPAKTTHSFRFWAIVAALSFTALCSAIEGTIITSALPTVTRDLGGGSSFIWVPNAYFLATIVMLPLMAQASNVFGRRILTLGAVVLFTLGSGICGGANSQAMLIGGRVVQGLGGGGIALMINIVLTDLVPLRERGKYMGIVQMVSAVGAALGPFLGGILTDRSTWRWVFYINVPIGGTQVIVPLVMGFVGLALFVTYEFVWAKHPSLPRGAILERTAATVLAVTFLTTLCTYWAFYFVPIYLQGVLGKSVLMSGVDALPLFAGLFPFAITGGTLLSKWGRYKPLHLIGMTIVTVSSGLFSLLDENSSTAAWACFQLLCAIGSGLMIAILLPAMQAPLEESLVTLSTGVWTFVRGFSTVWGVTIPAAVFNNECRRNAETLTDANLASFLQGGKAYQYATQNFLDSIQNPASRAKVIHIFSKSVRTVCIQWYSVLIVRSSKTRQTFYLLAALDPALLPDSESES
ncbi:major facilitator superfamily transporter [Seiridium cupressi]